MELCGAVRSSTWLCVPWDAVCAGRVCRARRSSAGLFWRFAGLWCSGGSWGAKTGGRHRSYWRAAALEWIDGYKEARYLATACEILRFAAAETCG